MGGEGRGWEGREGRERRRGGNGRGGRGGKGGGEEAAVECTGDMYVRKEGLQNNRFFAQISLAVTCSDLHMSLTTSNDGLQVDLMLRDLFGKLSQCIVR